MLNKRCELLSKIKESKKFNIKGIKGTIGVSNGIGLTGTILFDDDVNNIPFAYEEDDTFSYHPLSLEYAPVTKKWLQENLEDRLYYIADLYLQIDKASFI